MKAEVLIVGGTLSTRDVNVPYSTVVLLRGEGRNVLVDPGSFATHQALERRLSELGLKPEDITDVLLTHFHLDHAYASKYFENATVHLHRAYREKDYSKFGPIVGKEYISVMKNWKEVNELKGGEILFGVVKVFHTPWHAREHLSFLIRTDNLGTLFLPGDICFTRLDYYEMYKGYRKGEAVDFVLEMAQKADLLVFTHDEPLKPLSRARRV